MGIDKPYLLSEAFASFIETDSAQKEARSQMADKRLLSVVLYFFNAVRNKTSVQEINLEDLQRLQVWLKAEQKIGPKIKDPWTQTTIHFYCRTLKKFFKKMQHMDYIIKNPADYWKVPHGTNKRRRAGTFEEFVKIYEAAPKWFKPIFSFIYLTGSRPVGAADLKWQDVDFKKRRLMVTSRKGGPGQLKMSPIPIHPALQDLLDSLPQKDPMFPGPKGLPVTAQDISTEGSRLIRKVVCIPDLVLYSFRHALAVDMTEASIPTEIVRQGMTHSSIQQTSHYAKGTTSEPVREAFSQTRNIPEKYRK